MVGVGASRQAGNHEVAWLLSVCSKVGTHSLTHAHTHTVTHTNAQMHTRNAHSCFLHRGGSGGGGGDGGWWMTSGAGGVGVVIATATWCCLFQMLWVFGCTS